MSDMSENTHTKTMMLEVVTPYHHFFEGKVESVVLSALDGEYGVLPGHAPVVVALTPGIAHIIVKGKNRYAVMMEGFAEIGPYMTVVVCNAAEWPEDIDVARAQSAYERAVKRYRDVGQNPQERIYARHSMRRARMRLKLVADHGSEAQIAQLKDMHSV
jgi:F-type H+-transporting ATPase subunit epsilon